jgi:sialate O-acetylesterase
VLSSTEIAQGAMLLHFSQDDGGLVLKGSGRGKFEIAGADHIWFPAEAHLVSGVVVVSTSLVQQPTAVRYTWSSIATAALFNRAGVPAAPFHTDR